MGMQRKTIDGIITKKFNQWVATIDDENVRELVEKNTIITGGCIASMLMGENANDFDVYFTDFKTTHAVAEYYAQKYSALANVDVTVADDYGEQVRLLVDGDINRVSALFQELRATDSISIEDEDEALNAENLVNEDDTKIEITPYMPVFISPNAISLTDKIQIVLRFYGDAEAIHKNFDFIHCHNSWHSVEGITLKPEAVEAILAKQLMYTGSLYPLASVIRTRKFIKRGWKINAGQYLKMCLQLSDLNLFDIHVLQDQLTGVDVAYFFKVIEAIEENNEEKLTTAYLTEIIDRMF